MRSPSPRLFVQAAVGGPSDFDALAAAWLPHVHGWCHRLGGPTLDAEEAAYEVMAAAARTLDDVPSPTAFGHWLFEATRRTLAKHRRRAWWRTWLPRTLQAPPSPIWAPLRTVEAAQAAEHVWQALRALPDTQREALVLCDLEGRDVQEVAALMATPAGAVRRGLHAARKAFAEELTARGLDAGPAEVARCTPATG